MEEVLWEDGTGANNVPLEKAAYYYHGRGIMEDGRVYIPLEQEHIIYNYGLLLLS